MNKLFVTIYNVKSNIQGKLQMILNDIKFNLNGVF